MSENNTMQAQRQFIDVKTRTLTIELPESFVNHRVELIALIAEDIEVKKARRRPHPTIAGKGKTLGDLLAPVVDEKEQKATLPIFHGDGLQAGVDLNNSRALLSADDADERRF